MTRFAALLALFLGAATITPAAAQTTTPDIAASGIDKVALEVSRGQLIRLPRPVTAIFVADPAVAEVTVRSPTLVYIFAKKTGETTLYAIDGQERVVADIKLRVNHDISRLKEAIRQLHPALEIEAMSVSGGILVEGIVPTPATADDVQVLTQRFLAKDETVINRLSVTQPNQLNLRVRIAEVNRQLVKRFGINLDVLSAGTFAFGLTSGVATTTGAFPGTPIASRLNGVNNLVGAGRIGGVDLNAVVDALETEGLATVLAEPNLTAVSGETASFLAGGEFPIPVPQDNRSISITFKKFGVSLNFVPTILSGGRINLRVAPEVSQLSTNGAITLAGFSIPSLTTRRAETSVELASGQSLSIAGLIQNTDRADINKFPGLGDIPILGALFRSTAFNRNETELVIIVTPYLVNPVAPTSRLATPLDGLTPPNDVDRVVRSKTYREQIGPGVARAAAPNASGLIGPAGFVLE